MNKGLKHIAIVGGGTAGWLAALMIADSAKRAGEALILTVVESSRIGTIGVGEGTTAVFRQVLLHLGIDEMEFIRASKATIKYGIRHQDWYKKGHHYDGPIDDPNLLLGQGIDQPWLDIHALAKGRPVGELHLFQHLMKANKAPFAQTNGRKVAAGPFHYAYHFDQALAGAYLKQCAEGVGVIDDQVVGVNLHSQSGDISSLELEQGTSLEADFFIDASGFSRCLTKHLTTTWFSYQDVLPVNRAMPFWLDIAEGEEIPPYTLAWAQSAGWLWKIPTQERFGCGYVYSDQHLTADEAQKEIEMALGCSIEPRADIKIDAGRLDTAWNKNCVALGLCSSFLEPLEATSIHGTIVQLMLLTSMLGQQQEGGWDKVRLQYNQKVARQVDDYRDFIRCHYVTKRRDSAFWREVAATTPKNIQLRLEYWARNIPSIKDFPSYLNGFPHVEHQLYMPVLDGLGLLNRDVAESMLSESQEVKANVQRAYETLMGEYESVTKKVLSHRQFLETL